MENKKLYVGNLSYSTTEEQLTELFGEHGVVESVKLINDHETGRAKGFGFVEMATLEDAESAIKALDGHDFMGRAMRVNEAKPQQRRPRDGGGYGGGGFGGGNRF